MAILALGAVRSGVGGPEADVAIVHTGFPAHYRLADRNRPADRLARRTTVSLPSWFKT